VSSWAPWDWLKHAFRVNRVLVLSEPVSSGLLSLLVGSTTPLTTVVTSRGGG
jgi:hypothetical protein